MGKRRCGARGACAAVVMTAALISAAEEIETDRDAFTFAPTTVAVGRTLLETSYSFIDNRVGPEAHSVPELLARFGMGERIELRLGANYEAGGPGVVSGTEVGGEDVESEQESRLLYGTKIETSDQSGWIPQSAVIVQGFTPTSAPSTVLKIPVGERWNVHAEYFGILSSGKEEPINARFASFGGHVLVTDDFEIGLRVGWGLTDTSPEFFTNVGIGWQL